MTSQKEKIIEREFGINPIEGRAEEPALAAYAQSATNEEVFLFKQYLPEIVSLKQMQEIWGFNPNTIRRERWLQTCINEGKPIKPGQRYNASGLGFRLRPVIISKKVHYYTKDVIEYVKSQQEHSPEERVLDDVLSKAKSIHIVNTGGDFNA